MQVENGFTDNRPRCTETDTRPACGGSGDPVLSAEVQRFATGKKGAVHQVWSLVK